mmetsp:Transcript_19157/g.76753  ORF Transcript_19157/g.76753 Transcript_19157/m.76753 type:complete len:264 (-) Transcript_19157:2645-3436(-)
MYSSSVRTLHRAKTSRTRAILKLLPSESEIFAIASSAAVHLAESKVLSSFLSADLSVAARVCRAIPCTNGVFPLTAVSTTTSKQSRTMLEFDELTSSPNSLPRPKSLRALANVVQPRSNSAASSLRSTPLLSATVKRKDTARSHWCTAFRASGRSALSMHIFNTASTRSELQLLNSAGDLSTLLLKRPSAFSRDVLSCIMATSRSRGISRRTFSSPFLDFLLAVMYFARRSSALDRMCVRASRSRFLCCFSERVASFTTDPSI